MKPVCTDFQYGEECNKTCNCGNQTEVCDKRSGRCKSGCPDGLTGAACDVGKSFYIYAFLMVECKSNGLNSTQTQDENMWSACNKII